MPGRSFGLLLVEGGDERAVCEAVAGPAAWAGLCCWNANGRDNLVNTANLAKRDANFSFARSVGVVLDTENNVADALTLAAETLAVFGFAGTLMHGELSATSPPLGAFLLPDGSSQGCIETLCRRAVRDPNLAACVDALAVCAGFPHASLPNAQANADKGWLKAYLSMLADPTLRFHQAFSTPGGIDPTHAALDPLRTFLLAL
jgi:hypothetical protein